MDLCATQVANHAWHTLTVFPQLLAIVTIQVSQQRRSHECMYGFITASVLVNVWDGKTVALKHSGIHL